MRKTIAVTAATGALLLGGAGIANAEQLVAPASTTSTLAADDYGDNSDNNGLWGLAGLLGLLGLLGLRHRNHEHDRRLGAGTSMGTSGSTASSPTVGHNNPGHTPPTV